MHGEVPWASLLLLIHIGHNHNVLFRLAPSLGRQTLVVEHLADDERLTDLGPEDVPRIENGIVATKGVLGEGHPGALELLVGRQILGYEVGVVEAEPHDEVHP